MSEKKSRKPRTNIAPKNETPEQAFLRLATSRMSKCLQSLSNLSKLGRRKGWTLAQKNQILEALDNACTGVGEEFIVRTGAAPEAKGPLFQFK